MPIAEQTPQFYLLVSILEGTPPSDCLLSCPFRIDRLTLLMCSADAHFSAKESFEYEDAGESNDSRYECPSPLFRIGIWYGRMIDMHAHACRQLPVSGPSSLKGPLSRGKATVLGLTAAALSALRNEAETSRLVSRCMYGHANQRCEKSGA